MSAGTDNGKLGVRMVSVSGRRRQYTFYLTAKVALRQIETLELH